MKVGFDIIIRKCIDKSIYVELDCVECKDKEGKPALIHGRAQNFDNPEEALDYVRGLHDAVTMIQNQCNLIRIPETEEEHGEV